MATLDDPRITTFGRLLEATGRLSRQLGHDMDVTSGLPLTWFEVLLRLARSDAGRLTMGGLAEQLTLTTGGTTRLVDRLVDVGYLERQASPDDRRVAFAAITAAGQTVLDAAAVPHARVLAEVFAGFSDDEMTALDDLLDRLRGP